MTNVRHVDRVRLCKTTHGSDLAELLLVAQNLAVRDIGELIVVCGRTEVELSGLHSLLMEVSKDAGGAKERDEGEDSGGLHGGV